MDGIFRVMSGKTSDLTDDELQKGLLQFAGMQQTVVHKFEYGTLWGMRMDLGSQEFADNIHDEQ